MSGLLSCFKIQVRTQHEDDFPPSRTDKLISPFRSRPLPPIPSETPMTPMHEYSYPYIHRRINRPGSRFSPDFTGAGLHEAMYNALIEKLIREVREVREMVKEMKLNMGQIRSALSSQTYEINILSKKIKLMDEIKRESIDEDIFFDVPSMDDQIDE